MSRRLSSLKRKLEINDGTKLFIKFIALQNI